ncbi:hypothetical protein AB62_4294 [Escherichia coli 2-210-07_S1_C3]|nr:hypothetical protein AB62_4294 [Escherichia coli 2-210-07_S1_C3]
MRDLILQLSKSSIYSTKPHGGEMENVKVNKPTLLTDGCI